MAIRKLLSRRDADAWGFDEEVLEAILSTGATVEVNGDPGTPARVVFQASSEPRDLLTAAQLFHRLFPRPWASAPCQVRGEGDSLYVELPTRKDRQE